MKLLVLAVFLAASALCEGKTFTRCGLVRELRRHGFPESKMRDWVCLVENESARQTHVVGPPNRDGSRDHGLFQINDRYWCNDGGTPGNGCHVTCAELRRNNIRRAVSCVRKIYKVHGFSGWYGWVERCKGRKLPNISHC